VTSLANFAVAPDIHSECIYVSPSQGGQHSRVLLALHITSRLGAFLCSSVLRWICEFRMSTTPGKATSTANNSVQSFLTALVINAGALALEAAAFTYLHRKYARIYSPRSFLPPPRCIINNNNMERHLGLLIFWLYSKRSAALPLGFFRWIPAVIKAPAKEMVSSVEYIRLGGRHSMNVENRSTRMDSMRTCSFGFSRSSVRIQSLLDCG
jgi:hypothetical protein